MEDRETAQMRKYGESKTTRIMMATVLHVTSGLGLRKFQADGFLLTRVYHSSHNSTYKIITHNKQKMTIRNRIIVFLGHSNCISSFIHWINLESYNNSEASNFITCFSNQASCSHTFCILWKMNLYWLLEAFSCTKFFPHNITKEKDA